MRPTTARTSAVLALVAAALVLTGCGGGTAVQIDQGAPAGAGVDQDSGESGSSSALLVLSGTGRYTIGTEAPYGGYQLHGEPDGVPAGCTWAILDADGGVYTDESQGVYAFITDIPEAVTFVTDGCPDWEQFE